MNSPINALSPLDGRYAKRVDLLRASCSEHGLIKYRVRAELEWVKKLNANGIMQGVPFFSESTLAMIHRVARGFSQRNSHRIKAIEATTNHDVKAVEYGIREIFSQVEEMRPAMEFIHFGCTSEDITNVAHAMMLRDSRNILAGMIAKLFDRFRALAHAHADVPMLARTHGQPATPTTLGKEMAVFCSRLSRARNRIMRIDLTAKWNGASGNYNAAVAAYPDVDWEKLNRSFIEGLGFEWNPYTTQIESHDTMAELFDAVAHANTVLLDANRDLWQYISLGYFKQKLKAGEIGSSTMPHKVNPIDFENSEGNLGLANAILRHMSEKLPISRLQRDLTDSTVTRNIGTAFGYSLLAYGSCLNGLGKLEVDPVRIAADIDDAWELLAEPIQTVMRRYGVSGAYEQLKDMTRGKGITREALHEFIPGLQIPDDAKERLLALTPSTYIGLAEKLARSV
ncbi:MAG: adenylosuccinate lyase [Candidatus Moranbacteria bacterium]|nr:adenylosuccinate lyase [Candidatus Moranbacteria bacterium]